jgi:hypothetical protein
MIVKSIPREKLLVMDIKDGWEPLCKFLGKPVPNEPFPRANEAEVIEALGKRLLIKSLLIWLAILVGAGATIWVGLGTFLA